MSARKVISLVLKITVVLSSFYGVYLAVSADARGMLFFTIQSNIWIGIACLAGIVLMVTKAEIKRWMYSAKLICTVSITLTGVVFCVMLAPLYGDEAYSLVNVLTHVIVPAASILDFIVYDYPAKYKKYECLTVTIPPFYYLGFAGIGYVLRWDFADGFNYPYFFLNWGSTAGAFGFSEEFPYIGCFYYIVILVAFVIGVGALYIWLASLIRKITAKEKQTVVCAGE